MLKISNLSVANPFPFLDKKSLVPEPVQKIVRKKVSISTDIVILTKIKKQAKKFKNIGMQSFIAKAK